MKTIKTLFIFALLLCALTTVFGQTSAAERFSQAKEAFDNSRFEQTLTLLDAMEKDFGKSPRIESLRALTLRDLNRPRDAYLSVLTYFKLVEGKDYSNNAAHKELMQLRDTLKAQLETDLSVKKDNLQAERNENAEKAITESEVRSTSNSQSSNNADPLAELEIWNKVKTSTNANDYYLFIQRFPAGSFAKQAQAKMNEIGDPVWNEVKKSKDAFVYRDYIAKNPNSPFITEAKDKMNMLAASAIAWEQIKDSKNYTDFDAYIKKYPDGTYAEEAKKLSDEVLWKTIKDRKNIENFEYYIKKHPNGLYVKEVKNLIILNTPIYVTHDHSGGFPKKWRFSLGKWELISNGLKYTEIGDDEAPAKPEHSFELPCENLKSFKFSPGKVISSFKFKLADGDNKEYFVSGTEAKPGKEKEKEEELKSIINFIEAFSKACKFETVE